MPRSLLDGRRVLLAAAAWMMILSVPLGVLGVFRMEDSRYFDQWLCEGVDCAHLSPEGDSLGIVVAGMLVGVPAFWLVAVCFYLLLLALLWRSRERIRRLNRRWQLLAVGALSFLFVVNGILLALAMLDFFWWRFLTLAFACMTLLLGLTCGACLGGSLMSVKGCLMQVKTKGS